MSFPRYESYKDSGVAWLGKIPSHWGTTQSRRLFGQRKERARSSDDQLTASQKHGVIYQKDYMEIEGQKVVQVIRGAEILKHVEPNDFVISMRSFQGGIEWCGLCGSTSSAYVVLIPTKSVVPMFFRYLLKAPVYIQALQSTTNLVRDGQALRYENFTLVDLPTVPLAEQCNIAAFLDRETARIDALGEEQRRLIELLKEKQKAVISQAVTKGLNPNARMKHSGIAWLGEVPEHWEIRKFNAAIDYQEGPGILAIDFKEDGVPLMRVSGVQSRWATLIGCNYLDPEKVDKIWAHFKLVDGDLIISASASMGTVCEVGAEAVGAIPYTGLIRLRPKSGRTVRDYVRALVGSSLFFTQIDQLKAGATIQHFGPTHLGRMIVTIPPLEEQSEIAKYVDEQHRRFDDLIAVAEQGIALLQERRAALISAAVTGKIDVREKAHVELAVA